MLLSVGILDISKRTTKISLIAQKFNIPLGHADLSRVIFEQNTKGNGRNSNLCLYTKTDAFKGREHHVRIHTAKGIILLMQIRMKGFEWSFTLNDFRADQGLRLNQNPVTTFVVIVAACYGKGFI